MNGTSSSSIGPVGTGEELTAAEVAAQQKRRNRIQAIVAAIVILLVFVVLLPQLIDYGEVWEAMKQLTIAQLLVLAVLATLRMGASALLYASVIPGLGFKDSARSYLASNTVAEIAPPPADLAVRFGMYRSLGIDGEAAGVGIILSGVFSIGARLAIPVLALVALIVSGVDDDTIWLLALIGLAAVLGAGLIVVMALRSEDFTRRFAEWLGRGFNALLVRFQRDPIQDLGTRAVQFRARVGATMARTWPLASLATFLTHVFTFLILLTSMRYVGVTSDQVDWVVLLVAYAIVRLLTLIPLTPGGLGVAAVGYTFLLTEASEPDLANLIAAASFLTRIWVWLFPMIVGFGPLATWRRKMKEDPSRLTGGDRRWPDQTQ